MLVRYLCFSFLLAMLVIDLGRTNMVHAQAPSNEALFAEVKKKRFALGFDSPHALALRYGTLRVLYSGLGVDYNSSIRYHYNIIIGKRIDFYVFFASSVHPYERQNNTGLYNASGMIIAIGGGHGSEFYFLKSREGFSLLVEAGFERPVFGGYSDGYPRPLYAGIGLYYHF